MPIDSYIQYGCFAIIAGLVIWAMKWGIPNMLETHRLAIERLTDTFTRAEDNCREERMLVASQAAIEREKDRESRHALANKFQELLAEIKKNHVVA